MPLNALGRDIPDYIEGYGLVRPYQGAFVLRPDGQSARRRLRYGDIDVRSKVLPNLKAAIAASGLESGMTISFHHHLRNGDYVVNQVLDACADMGLQNLTLFPTALFDVHAHIMKHIKSGVIGRIMGSVNGSIGRFISEGGMKAPVVLRSHDERPRPGSAPEAGGSGGGRTRRSRDTVRTPGGQRAPRPRRSADTPRYGVPTPLSRRCRKEPQSDIFR